MDVRSERSEDRARWDARYAAERQALGPSPFLVAMADFLPPRGRALDVATGSGREAIFLAARGLSVVGIDVSPVGLGLARRRAEERALHLDLIAADLLRFPLPRAAFDVVTCFHYLERSLFPALEASLRPGGVLVFETFTTDQLAFPEAHPRREAFLLRPNELLRAFPGLHVQHYEEKVRFHADGSRSVTAGLVAVRRT